MATAALKDIKPGRRHRKDLGDIEALASSIQANGLLHAIVVTDDLTLVCGRRRLEACKRLGWIEIPVNTVSLESLLLAERDENTVRKDFTPSEAVEIGEALQEIESIAAAKRKKAGTNQHTEPEGKIPQASKGKTSDKVAAAVGMSGKTYEKAKAVVAAAKADPEKFGDLPKLMDDTNKVHQAHAEIKRREKREELKEKAKVVSVKSVEWDVIDGDCIDSLDGIQNRTARLIFADPPYNIGIDYGQGSQGDRLSDDDFWHWCWEWMHRCAEKLTADGSLWVMINDEYADFFGMLLRETGLTRRAWIKWYETFGVNCSNNFNRTSRHIFYCVKDPKNCVFNADSVTRPSDRQTKYGDKRADPGGKIWDDVWQIPRLSGTCDERIPDVPTQLPLQLVRAIVGCASEPGDLVIDPFCGSGTTGVASVESGRRFIGLEKNPAFAIVSRSRISSSQKETAA